MSEIKLTLPFAVAPARLFGACTEPEALTRWFSEHAKIDLDGGRYDFWGCHTPGAPDREAGHHPITRFEPNRLLTYQWRLRGADTEVTYEFVPTALGSEFRLTHCGLPELSPQQSSIGDFWTHVLEGLKQWLEHDRPYQLMDFAHPPHGDVRLSIDIASDAATVFRALTDPVQLNRWIATDAKVEPVPGGVIDFGWGAGPVKILELVPDQRLSHTWRWAGESETITTWQLEGTAGGTRLTVVQSGFAPERHSEDYYIGWTKFIWRLKAMLETGTGWDRARASVDTEMSASVAPEKKHVSE